MTSQEQLTAQRLKRKTKAKLELTKENLKIVAPYLWVKHVKKIEKKEKIRSIQRPSDLIRDLSMFLSDTVKIPNVINETVSILKLVTQSNGGHLYLVDSIKNEIYFCPKDEENMEKSTNRLSWKIGEPGVIPAYVAEKKEVALMNDLIHDENFPNGMYAIDGTVITAVLCVPIVNLEGETFGVIELFRNNGEDYDDNHLQTVIAVTGWMGVALDQNQRRLDIQNQHRLNEYLLDLSQHYFEKKFPLENMISDITKFAKETLNCQRGSFFVMNNESDELEADYFDESVDDEENPTMQKKIIKLRFQKERGIASQSIRTGEIVNIKDAYLDPNFDRETDYKTGIRTRSIICLPIHGQNRVVAVLQLINKKTGGEFTKADEKMVHIFGTYCSLALNYTKCIEHLNREQKLKEICLELLPYQINATVLEPELLIDPQEITIPSGFNEFAWYPFPNYMDQLIPLSYFMINSLCGEKLTVSADIFQFLFCVRRSYRKNPYHNFEHAFNVLHSLYCMMTNHSKEFSILEKISLVITGICHDIDHRGYTNSFLQISNSPLVALYEDSPLENHHYWLTIIILKNSKLLKNLSTEEHKEVTDLIRDEILATDLTQHLKYRFKMNSVINEGHLDWENSLHKSYIRSIMMTSADLSGQGKPYEIAKRLVENVLKEFYEEGDKLKEMGKNPLPLMDRSQTNRLPEDQIQFLVIVCLPCFDMLRIILPKTQDIYVMCKQLKFMWKDLIALRGKKVWNVGDSNNCWSTDSED